MCLSTIVKEEEEKRRHSFICTSSSLNKYQTEKKIVLIARTNDTDKGDR
jgi:hypothetical protein